MKEENRRMKPVTIRLPPDLVERIKEAAESRNIPYQKLVRDVLSKTFRYHKRKE